MHDVCPPTRTNCSPGAGVDPRTPHTCTCTFGTLPHPRPVATNALGCGGGDAVPGTTSAPPPRLRSPLLAPPARLGRGCRVRVRPGRDGGRSPRHRVRAAARDPVGGDPAIPRAVARGRHGGRQLRQPRPHGARRERRTGGAVVGSRPIGRGPDRRRLAGRPGNRRRERRRRHARDDLPVVGRPDRARRHRCPARRGRSATPGALAVGVPLAAGRLTHVLDGEPPLRRTRISSAGSIGTARTSSCRATCTSHRSSPTAPGPTASATPGCSTRASSPARSPPTWSSTSNPVRVRPEGSPSWWSIMGREEIDLSSPVTPPRTLF